MPVHLSAIAATVVCMVLLGLEPLAWAQAAGVLAFGAWLIVRIPEATPTGASLANGLTGVRLGMTAALLGAVGHWSLAPGPVSLADFAVGTIAWVAFALDGLDGWVARTTRTTTRFGARLDMEVDAAFVLALSALLVWSDRAPSFVLLAGLLRYGFGAAQTWVPRLSRSLPERRGRRLACGIGVGGLASALCPLPASLAATSAVGATLVLVGSFAIDVMLLFRSPFQRFDRVDQSASPPEPPSMQR